MAHAAGRAGPAGVRAAARGAASVAAPRRSVRRGRWAALRASVGNDLFPGGKLSLLPADFRSRPRLRREAVAAGGGGGPPRPPPRGGGAPGLVLPPPPSP